VLALTCACSPVMGARVKGDLQGMLGRSLGNSIGPLKRALDRVNTKVGAVDFAFGVGADQHSIARSYVDVVVESLVLLRLDKAKFDTAAVEHAAEIQLGVVGSSMPRLMRSMRT
jgi:hypothetical protein